MSAEKIARMANQIAVYFRSYPEAEAVAGVAEHVKAFWTPAMLAQLYAIADEKAQPLDPLVIAATRLLRGGAEPRAEDPASRSTDGPDAVGQLGSDAG